jgi:hypothetical protein
VQDAVAGFALSSRGIYFISSGRLQFLDFPAGKSKTLLTLDKPIHLGMALSPDEKWLLYSQVDQGGSDLMLVDNFR